MDVAVTHACECTGKNYKTKSALAAHKKTKIHMQWEVQAELRGLKVQLTKRDNKIVGLQADKQALQELNMLLVREVQRARSAAPECAGQGL